MDKSKFLLVVVVVSLVAAVAIASWGLSKDDDSPDKPKTPSYTKMTIEMGRGVAVQYDDKTISSGVPFGVPKDNSTISIKISFPSGGKYIMEYWPVSGSSWWYQTSFDLTMAETLDWEIDRSVFSDKFKVKIYKAAAVTLTIDEGVEVVFVLNGMNIASGIPFYVPDELTTIGLRVKMPSFNVIKLQYWPASDASDISENTFIAEQCLFYIYRSTISGDIVGKILINTPDPAGDTKVTLTFDGGIAVSYYGTNISSGVPFNVPDGESPVFLKVSFPSEGQYIVRYKQTSDPYTTYSRYYDIKEATTYYAELFRSGPSGDIEGSIFLTP